MPFVFSHVEYWNNDDTSESTVSCDDNDDIQGVVPIVSDSE